jgi:cob(I)alamin adenosyltransferase
MKIYTKKGDKGQTDLFNSQTGSKERVSKTDPRLVVIGNLDELNCILGIVKALSKNSQTKLIESVQTDIFTINSILAGKPITFSAIKVGRLERQIDLMEKSMPPIHNFIIPGGEISSAYFHLARAVARRSERHLVKLSEFKGKESILKYVNRLSDFLFVMARYQNYQAKTKDLLWKRTK